MKSRPFLFPVVTSLCGLLALLLLVDPPRKPARGPHQEVLLPREDVLRVVGRGYIQMIADYLWIQLVQTAGRAVTAEEYRDLYPYAELITDLDPYFDMVYRFAAGTLPTNLGRETWVNTEESTRLLRKGLKLFPDDLKMNMLLAYNLSTFEKNYQEAAQLTERASRLPGAPAYLPQLATRLYAQAGSVDAGLALAESLLDSAEDEATRQLFEQRIRDLELEAELQRVDVAIARFHETYGVLPPDVDTLSWLGFLSEPPHDPQGGGFFIGSDGRAYSRTQQRRLEIFTPFNRGRG
ncbi:tetratricopeptide repeat protein [Cystobacter ferrugineus]|nr:tetratricopeptide repeat protein [Cystobacter ferrugineus]